MVLTVSNLCYQYQKQAKPIFSNVNLSLQQGQLLCLLGSNGTGKTTLLRCLIGSLVPTSGNIYVAGKSLTESQPARLVSYVPQSNSDCMLPLLDMVLLGRTPHLRTLSQPGERDRNIAYQALKLIGLEHLASTPFNQVSGGERQLTLIARALAQEPKLLIMDEPTASLDLGNQARVLRVVKKLAESGLGVLFTTHQPEHALLINSDVAVLHQGVILTQGNARSTLSSQLLSETYRWPIKIYDADHQHYTCAPVI